MTDWTWRWSYQSGAALIFFNMYDVASYATAQIKGGSQYHPVRDTPDSIRVSLLPGGSNHEHLVEGGWYWKKVKLNIAERDGDTSERYQQLLREENTRRQIVGLPPRAVGARRQHRYAA